MNASAIKYTNLNLKRRLKIKKAQELYQYYS